MDRPSRRSLPRWPSFAVLLVAGAYLAARWDSIPARWVIHWGPGGAPNGWATRTLPGVYGLLAVAAVLLLVSESVAAMARLGEADGTSPMRAASIDSTRIVMFGISVTMAVLAVDLPLGPRLPLPALILVSVAPVLASVAACGMRLAATLRHEREHGPGARFEGHHGLYYASSNDRRLWVPKLSGMGWTINFSHPLAWPMFLLLLAVPIGAVVLTAAAR
jgi:uncharacterized membrane protein